MSMRACPLWSGARWAIHTQSSRASPRSTNWQLRLGATPRICGESCSGIIRAHCAHLSLPRSTPSGGRRQPRVAHAGSRVPTISAIAPRSSRCHKTTGNAFTSNASSSSLTAGSCSIRILSEHRSKADCYGDSARLPGARSFSDQAAPSRPRTSIAIQ